MKTLVVDNTGANFSYRPRLRAPVPFKRGELLFTDETAQAHWLEHPDAPIREPASLIPMQNWDDGSLAWGLLDARVPLLPDELTYQLVVGDLGPVPPADPHVLEHLTPGADGRITFVLEGELEDAAARVHPLHFVAVNPPFPLPDSPTWKTYLLAARLEELHLTAYLVFDWPIDGRIVHWTAFLAADHRAHWEKPLIVKRWTIRTEALSLWPHEKDLYHVPNPREIGGGLAWDLIHPSAPAALDWRAAQRRRGIGVFDAFLEDAQRADVIEASELAAHEPFLAPSADTVEESGALGLHGGPVSPRLRSNEVARIQIEQDLRGYLAQNHFGPMGDASPTAPWGTYAYSGVTGTPFNKPLPTVGLYAHPIRASFQKAHNLAGHEAARRQHWLPYDWDPKSEEPAHMGPVERAGVLNAESSDPFNPLDLEHPFIPDESLALAMRGDAFHLINVWNRAREAIYQWSLGFWANRSEPMPTRGECWWSWVAALSRPIFWDMGLERLIVDRLHKVESRIFWDGVHMGYVHAGYDFKSSLRTEEIPVWHEAPWQVGYYLADVVGIWRRFRYPAAARLASKLIRILRDGVFLANEWEPGHPGGWFYFYPCLVGKERTPIERDALREWVAPNGRQVEPTPNIGIDTGFAWSGVVAYLEAVVEGMDSDAQDRLRADDLHEWFKGFPGWIPSYVSTMPWRELPSRYLSRRV